MILITAPDGRYLPKKELTEKRWMDGTVYHSRVQKKWNKKHGLKWFDACPRGQVKYFHELDYIMCNKADYSKLKPVVDKIPCQNSKPYELSFDFKVPERERDDFQINPWLWGQPILRNNNPLVVTA